MAERRWRVALRQLVSALERHNRFHPPQINFFYLIQFSRGSPEDARFIDNLDPIINIQPASAIAPKILQDHNQFFVVVFRTDGGLNGKRHGAIFS